MTKTDPSAPTDWDTYDYCDDCTAVPGETCYHLTTNDPLHRPHPRRHKKKPQ